MYLQEDRDKCRQAQAGKIKKKKKSKKICIEFKRIEECGGRANTRGKMARIIPEDKEETASEQNVDDMNCRLSKYLIVCVILRKIRVCLCVCVCGLS